MIVDISDFEGFQLHKILLVRIRSESCIVRLYWLKHSLYKYIFDKLPAWNLTSICQDYYYCRYPWTLYLIIVQYLYSKDTVGTNLWKNWRQKLHKFPVMAGSGLLFMLHLQIIKINYIIDSFNLVIYVISN